jgi:hypothetical protein
MGNAKHRGEVFFVSSWFRFFLFIFLALSTISTALAQEATEPSDGTEVVTDTFTINGQVTNGTAGASVPADMELTLFVFPPDATQQQFETTADANGAYSFTDVPFQSDWSYVVTTAYRDHVFTSPLTPGSQLTGDPATLPVTIYELTEDPAVIEIVGMVTQTNVSGDNLEVAQVFSIANNSDRAYSTTQTTPDGRTISLVFPLPPGAIVPGFAEQGRYVFVQDEFTVLDTVPVLPGEEHIVQLIYFISYGGDAIIEQELNYALNGPVRLLVRPENVVVTSDQLTAQGPEVVGNAQFASYGAELSLPAGSVLSYELSGQGGASSAVPVTQAAATSDNLLPILLALLLVGVVVAVFFLLFYYYRRRAVTDEAAVPSQTLPRRRGKAQREAQLIDILVTQIAELDASYEAGEIEKTAYDRERADLKTRLSDLMRQEQKEE